MRKKMVVWLVHALVLVTVGAGWSNASRANQPGILPVLETGGHMAVVKNLHFTPDGNFIVSAGNDKAIRVWNWRTGAITRTLRGQSGPGPDGKIQAMALSPDGRWLAVAGSFGIPSTAEEESGNPIRLYDFLTGNITALLLGHKKLVLGLAFSPNSKWLVSGASGGAAIVWDVSEARLSHRLESHQDDVYAVAFTPDSERVVTGSYDKTLRLWGVDDGAEIAVLAGHTEMVRAVAVSSATGLIASSVRGNAGEVRLWDGKTGAFVRTLVNVGTGVGSLTFTPDGKHLVSTCGRYCKGAFFARIWEIDTGSEINAYRTHDDVVLATAISPDGEHVATGGGSNNEIHVWNLRSGEQLSVLKGVGAPVWSVGLSDDGAHLAWGTANPCADQVSCPNQFGELEYQIKLPFGGNRLGNRTRVDQGLGFARARARSGHYSLLHRKGGKFSYNAVLELLQDGDTVSANERASNDGFEHLTYTFAPDNKSYVSGGRRGWLTAFNLSGDKLGEFYGHEGEVWAATPHPTRDLLISGSDDQTLRVWNSVTRELLVTFFFASNDEWVGWTPQGFYASSPLGDNYMGWQINQGADQAADYVTARQLSQHFYRPELVERAIILGSAVTAVHEAKLDTFKLDELLMGGAPDFKVIHLPSQGFAQIGRALIDVELNRNVLIESLDLYVNKIKIESRGSSTEPIGQANERARFEVPLARGKNSIRVVARSQARLKTEKNVEILNEGQGPLDKRDTLHIVAIGVDRYPSAKGRGAPVALKDLSYASKDAVAFAELAAKVLGPDHQKIRKLVIASGRGRESNPTKGNIENARAFIRGAKANDTIVFFLAGHGVNDPHDGYLFLPTDAKWEGNGWKPNTVYRWSELEASIQNVNGRRILLVDTCRSSNAYNARLQRDAEDADIMVLSATREQQDAWELAELKHGAFTWAILQGLGGKAAASGVDVIRAYGLAQFVRSEVERITNGKQSPEFYQPRGSLDHILARVRK